MRRIYFFLVMAVAITACTPVPAPQPPPTPDASDAAAPRAWDAGPVVVRDANTPDDVFDIACKNLVAIGCAEGDDPICADRMRRAEQENQTRYNAPCVATQKTAEGIRWCAPAWKNGCRGPRSSP